MLTVPEVPDVEDGNGRVARERAAPVQVRVYQQGRLVDSTVCESEAEATALMAHWSNEADVELEDVEFEVDDLSIPHRSGDILEPDRPAPSDPEETAART